MYLSLAEFMPQVKVEQVETVEGCSHEVKNVDLQMDDK